jgi:uncharacterized membrane protein
MFSSPARRQRQKGVISIMAAVALGVALIAAALALDLGHVAWVKRDLQKAADLSSLSAVTNLSQATTTAQNIALANGFDYQNETTANSLTVTTGVYDWTNRTFAPGGAAESLNSVQVTAATTVKYYFLPGSLRVQAIAISALDANAGFSLGSFLARLDTRKSVLLNGLLGGLLGGSINLDLVSYQGLAAANVTLAGLQAALKLGTVDEVLNLNLSLGDLLNASITALNNKGDPISINAAGILGPIQAAVSPALSLKLGDLLKVDLSNPGAAANVEVNILQLVQLAAQVANGTNLVSIPNLGISLLGLGDINLALSLIGAPSIAIGPARKDADGAWMTRAHAAQLRLRLNINLLGLINLPIYIEGGAADAQLTGIQCKVPRDDSLVTIQNTPKLLEVYIGDVQDNAMQNHSAPVTVNEATLVDLLGLLKITGKAYLPLLPRPTEELVFTGPFDQNNVHPEASRSLGLGEQLNTDLLKDNNLTVELLGLEIPLGPILGILLAILGPLLDALLDPLLSLLGLQLGGADVTVFSLNCGVAQLVY